MHQPDITPPQRQEGADPRFGAPVSPQQKAKVLSCISELLSILHPERQTSREVNQIAQELSFLHSSISLDLSLPQDWRGWLVRIVRSGTLDRVPEARDSVRHLVGHLADPNFEPTRQFPKPELVRPTHAKADEVKYFLRLFISGNTRPSRSAMENLEVLSANLGSCKFEVIDIQNDPQLAESERIVATPTLLRDFPIPKRKIIGDLSDINTVMLILSA